MKQEEQDEEDAGQVHAAQQVGEGHERHARAEEQQRHVGSAQQLAPDDAARAQGADVEQVGI